MKVGDLVTASHWIENQTAVVVDISRLDRGIVSVYLGSYVGDYMAGDLEVISESR